MQYVVAAILWLVKLITDSLEKVNIKRKRVVEKVTNLYVNHITYKKLMMLSKHRGWTTVS